MNSVHLVTQEKKNESKRIENGPSAPSTLPKARPRAQLPGRAPAAQPTQPHALRTRPRLLPLACRAPVPPAAARPSAPRVPAPSACARASVRLPPARSARLAQRPSSSLMGSSPFQGLQQNFFFIKIKFFFSIYFQKLEKSIKSLKSFFFSSNKFLKIYFLQFSSNKFIKNLFSFIFFFPNFVHCTTQNIFYTFMC